jgi:glycosyltransferase involved in cell wall biosynthesis
MLTVAIPTFNRLPDLLSTVEALLPQFDDDTVLLIVDNCSTEPVAPAVQKLVRERKPDLPLTVVRNRTNIGLSANILRCFESCQTEYMWLLGDDDAVEPNALQTIRQHIVTVPEAIYWNFATGHFSRPESFSTKGRFDFLHRLDSIYMLLCISGGVYRVSSFLPHLSIGYLYSYSIAPHFALLLAATGDDQVCFFSPAPVIRYQQNFGEGIDGVDALLGLPILLDYFSDDPLRAEMARHLDELNPSLKWLCFRLCLGATKHYDVPTALYLFNQIVSRSFHFRRPASFPLQVIVFRALLHFPRASLRLFRFFGRLIGNDTVDRTANAPRRNRI